MGQSSMVHKDMLDAAERDNDERWNQAVHPCMLARATASESSSSFIPPMENMTIQSGLSPSSWTPAPRSNGYSSSTLSAESPCHHPQYPGTFAHQPPGGNYHIVPDTYSHHPSSSVLSGQTISDVGLCDRTIGRIRGSHKRKSPAIPQLRDMVSTSGYDIGSSSHLHLPADPWQGKRNIESHQTPWEYPPPRIVNSLSIGSEDTSRNVRRRFEIDLEPNPMRTSLSRNSLHHPFSCLSSNQSNSVDSWRQRPNASTRECNPCLVAPAGQGVNFGRDSSSTIHDPNPMNTLSGFASGLVESEAHTLSWNHAPQNASGNLNPSVGGIQSGYHVQRSFPSSRASSSNFQASQEAVADEGLQMSAKDYPSRHQRGISTFRLRIPGRTGITSDRYRSFSHDADSYNRFTPEGVVFADHPTFSGTLFDHHRDMRLDIDNMSYEDLLVLGERIGIVNTGLSDDLISKCLTEAVYCSSETVQDEGKCVICLEEYKNMDDVGSLKCGHDFHVCCVKKWLSLKNLCPICKKPAIDDSIKEKSSA